MYRKSKKSGLWLPGEGQGLSHLRRPHFHPNLVNPFVYAGGGGAGWGWSPLDVSGLVWWFAADRGVVEDGSGNRRVVTMTDQSGSAHVLTASSGGGGPIEVRDNATAGIEEIFHFPGGANWAVLTFGSNPHASLTACHMFWGVKWTDDPPASSAETGLYYLSDYETATTHSLFFTDGNFYDALGGATRFSPVGNPGVAMTDYRCVDIQNQTGANGYKFHIDGSLLGQGTGDGSNWCTAPTLGRVDNFPTNVISFNGRWIDWFMYDHVLTGGDLVAARDFVAARFDGSWLAAGGD